MKNVREWTKIFKGLGNDSRLKIIQMLYPNNMLSVSDVKRRLGISYRWTSRNLVNLEKIGILTSHGIKGHVFYFIDPKLPNKVRQILKLLFK